MPVDQQFLAAKKMQSQAAMAEGPSRRLIESVLTKQDLLANEQATEISVLNALLVRQGEVIDQMFSAIRELTSRSAAMAEKLAELTAADLKRSATSAEDDDEPAGAPDLLGAPTKTKAKPRTKKGKSAHDMMIYSKRFEEFWAHYCPLRSSGKAEAAKRFDEFDAETQELIIEAALHQVRGWKQSRIEIDYIPHASTWLNKRTFMDFVADGTIRTPETPALIVAAERRSATKLPPDIDSMQRQWAELVYWMRMSHGKFSGAATLATPSQRENIDARIRDWFVSQALEIGRLKKDEDGTLRPTKMDCLGWKPHLKILDSGEIKMVDASKADDIVNHA
jgi:hypothetical protein